jgi:hypothetical protein
MLVATLLLGASCGRLRNDPVVRLDASVMDAAVADSSRPETPPDAAAMDSAVRDGAPPDSAPLDTGLAEDASVEDAAVADAGADAGTEIRGQDDFESYPLGAAPASWIPVWNDGGQDYQAGIDISTSADQQLFVRVNTPAPLYHAAVKNASVTSADIEVLFLTGSSPYLNFALRAQGDSYLGHDAYVVNVWTDMVMLVRSEDSSVAGGSTYGGWSMLGSVACPACGSSNKWVRFRVEGTSLKARIWAEGDTEPTAWTLEATDDHITGAGWFGPVTYTNYVTRIREIAWATDGATAAFTP